MRDLKFRVWNSISKEFTYFDTPRFTLAEKTEPQVAFENVTYNKIMLGGYKECEQYTGVDTEDGAEIYEGDICDPVGVVGQYLIVWSDHYRRVMAKGISYILGGNLEVSSMSRCEIVGTVHQNPDLLENPK